MKVLAAGRAISRFSLREGRSMHWKTQSSTTLPPDTSTLGLALDSESPFADELLPLNFAGEEKQSFDPAFQTLPSEANQELAFLLREVHNLAQQRQVKTFVEFVLPIIDKHLARAA
jgi:hypothetical protein